MIELPPKLAVNSHDRRTRVSCRRRVDLYSRHGLRRAALLRNPRLAAAAWVAGPDCR